jgi:hypothetical protein
MKAAVTMTTERNEVLGGIVAEQTTRTDMMDLEIVAYPAVLTAPTISLQHLLAQLTIETGSEPYPRALGLQ